MRKRLFLWIGLFLLCYSMFCFAETNQNRSVAILDFKISGPADKVENLRYLQDSLPELFTDSFAATRQVRVITRSQIAAALTKLNVAAKTGIDEKTACEIGKTLEADYVVTGQLMILGAKLHLSVRLISVSTGEIETAAIKPGASEDEISIMAEGVTKEILQHIMASIPTPEPTATPTPTPSPIPVKTDNRVMENLLFPVEGVTLGKTTVQELARLGKRDDTIDDDTGDYFEDYIINGFEFWYDNGVANHMYLTHSEKLPDKWENMGMAWQLSYDQWIVLLKQLGCEIKETEPPTIQEYRGHDSFFAAFKAVYSAGDIKYEIELEFKYSESTTRSASKTLYSLRVRVLNSGSIATPASTPAQSPTSRIASTYKLCNSCGGTGLCKLCHGTGSLPFGLHDFIPCGICNGTGICSYCRGTGEVKNY